MKTANSALNHAKKFVELSQDKSEALTTLANAYARLAILQTKVNDTDGSLTNWSENSEVWKKVAAQNPTILKYQLKLWESYDRIGKIYLDKKKYKKAIAIYETSLPIAKELEKTQSKDLRWSGESFLTYVKIGDANRISKNYDAMLASYRQAYELAKTKADMHPKNRVFQKYKAMGQYGIGYGLYHQNKCKEAIPWFKMASEGFRPFNTDELKLQYATGFKYMAYFRTGYCHGKLKQYDKSIISYGHVLQVNPNYKFALNNRANSYLNRGDPELSLPDIERAIQLYPNYAYAWNTRGKIYEKIGRKNEAIENYVEALKISPSLSESLERLRELGAEDRIPKKQ